MSRLNNFLTALSNNGDMFFTSGNKKQDLSNIEATIANQGYWAGISLRYFFDKDLNLIRTEERTFGN